MSVLLAGCAHHRPPVVASVPVKPAPVHSIQNPALALLDYAHQLTAFSPQAREAAVNAARNDIRSQPNATDYARLALALGTPGQRLYTPDEAARYAGLALKTTPSPWNTAARQYLTDYARLYTQLTRSRASNSVGATSAVPKAGDDAHASAGSSAEVQRLQTELAEARRKLAALAHIEDRLDSADSDN